MSGRAPSSRPRHAQPQSWDDLAAWWRATFTNGADVEYDHQILPLAAAHLAGCLRILDLGCGEGQLARRLARGVCPDTADSRRGGAGGAGASSPTAAGPPLVVGLDPFRRQLENAVAQGGGATFVQGAGEQLPFPPDTFDAVVC